MSAKQVDESVQDGAVLFALLAKLDLGEKQAMGELPIVCDFPEVFPDDVSDLPPEREVEFLIHLIPGTSPVSMSPYRMSASELKELKSQLEVCLIRSLFVLVCRRGVRLCCWLRRRKVI